MEERLIKDQVVAWIITQEPYESAQGRKTILNVKPVSVDWSGETDVDALTLRAEEKIVAVVPALPGTYEVWGAIGESGPCECLGYEMPGAFCPDWSKELESMRRLKARTANKG